MVASYYDKVVDDLGVGLYRKSSEAQLMMAAVNSDGEIGYDYGTDDGIVYEKIDNQSYSYYAIVYLPANNSGDLCLVSVRVDYGFTGFLPAVLK